MVTTAGSRTRRPGAGIPPNNTPNLRNSRTKIGEHLKAGGSLALSIPGVTKKIPPHNIDILSSKKGTI